MRKALVVDDEGPIRNLIAAVLRRERIQADTAAHGKEAVDLIRVNDYGCVLLDLMMPVMDGRQVIEEMLHHRIKRVPVVVITAAGEGATADLDPEVVKVIVRKPFDVARVIEAVRAFCMEESDPELDRDWLQDTPRITM